MRKFFLALSFVMCIRQVNSQSTVCRRWDARFGGLSDDDISIARESLDGSIYCGGTSYSGVSGNKTEPSRGDADYWLVKTDINGNYLWDKRFGGSGPDYFKTLTPTKDGGCILGGFSGSQISGDKTQQPWGGFDIWIVKIDSSGNKQWDKRYGGAGDEDLSKIRQTEYGQYIIAGITTSGVSGDVSEPNRDSTLSTYDYWIIKVDSSGDKLWDKRIGSGASDGCTDILLTSDGGYLLGGTSRGDISGDKSQPNFTTVIGGNYWVVKIDSLRNKKWDKVFGGNYGESFGNALELENGDYVLGGTSYSTTSGNKTMDKCGYWLVRIDSVGNKLADWIYGASDNSSGSGGCGDEFLEISRTNDSGYLLTGRSASPPGGDKSETNIGSYQGWTIKIDSHMRKVWDKTSLTQLVSSFDEPAGAFEARNGCYVVAMKTAAGVAGDKTQPNWDTTLNTDDYWLIEYCDTVYTSIIDKLDESCLSIYPNPTSADISIILKDEKSTSLEFTLRNVLGELVYQSYESNLPPVYIKTLNLGNLSNGIYLLDITRGDKYIRKKIIKN